MRSFTCEAGSLARAIVIWAMIPAVAECIFGDSGSGLNRRLATHHSGGSMLRTLALSGIVLLVCASAEAARVQVNLPYNVDIVREVGGTTTAGPGFGGLGLVTQEYAEAND